MGIAINTITGLMFGFEYYAEDDVIILDFAFFRVLVFV